MDALIISSGGFQQCYIPFQWRTKRRALTEPGEGDSMVTEDIREAHRAPNAVIASCYIYE